MTINEAKFAGSCTRVSQKPSRKLPEFAFIGRSNVGKSSLINMLCGNRKLAKTSQTPGNTKLIQEGREELRKMINDYIGQSEDMVLLFVLIDCRHDITRIDRDFITGLGENGIPFAIIFTKCDKLGPNALKAQIERDRHILSEQWEELPPMFTSSADTGAGRDEILEYIRKYI